MAPLDGATARALNLTDRFTSPENVARAMFYAAHYEHPADDLPVQVAEWFAVLANELGEYVVRWNGPCDITRAAQQAVDEAGSKMRSIYGPAILGAIEPQRELPNLKAGSVCRNCKTLALRAAVPFALAILRDWVAQGLLTATEGRPI